MGQQGGNNVIQHLNKALEADDTREKNYYIRQALQHLDIESVSN